jgi:hypothetical protein
LSVLLFCSCSYETKTRFDEYGNIVNHISSSKILELTPDMNWFQIAELLGGKENEGAAVSPSYIYILDNKSLREKHFCI